MRGSRLMQVVAVPVPPAANESRRLELQVYLRPSGQLETMGLDETPHRCRLMRGGRAEWSGTIRRDDEQWVVHSDLGDDEPIKVLLVRSLRPGEHLTLCDPGHPAMTFRVQQVSQTLRPSASIHVLPGPGMRGPASIGKTARKGDPRPDDGSDP